jgi:hypothetical protein
MYTYIYIYVYIERHMHIYIYICTHIYICIYTHMHILAEKLTARVRGKAGKLVGQLTLLKYDIQMNTITCIYEVSIFHTDKKPR